MEALEHQQVALDEIVARAKAYFRGDWRHLFIQPLWASLLIGPSGSGKTAVAAMAAEAVGASMLRISAPNWMPVGAIGRGTKETMSVIAEHIARHDKTLLVLDEGDKLLDRAGDSSWKSYIRGECFQIIGKEFLPGLTLPETDYDKPEITIEQLTTKLRNTVFILMVGTFQEWFDDAPSRRSMGFGAETNPAKDELSADIIAEKLPRELANRFHSSIIRLPELKPDDYHRISKEAENSLPERMRALFHAEVQQRLPIAIAAKKGVRFLEEAITEVLKKLPPEPLPPPPDFFQVTADIDLCTL